MKNLYVICVTMCMAGSAISQVGIGTTSPNSMLDVRGAMSLSYRSFTGNTTIGNNDNTIVFTGSSDATATLPEAGTCTGRIYRIKNASTENVTPVLTILTCSGQVIDGITSGWTLDEANEAVTLVSNGTGWYISSQTNKTKIGSYWAIGGNTANAEKKFGTVSNFALPFITNNTERLRITEDGKLGIGTNKPITGAHIQLAGVTSGISETFINGITITGNGTYGFGGPGFYLENKDNPVQKKLFKINYTANGGSEAYINFQSVTDNGSANVNANILAVSHSGRVGIGTATFNSSNPEKLLVDAGYTNSYNAISAKGNINNHLQMNVQNNSTGVAASTNIIARADNGNEVANFVNMGINSSGFAGTTLLGGANNAYLFATGNDFIIGNASINKQLIFFAGGTSTANEIMRLNSRGILPGSDNMYSLGKNGARWSEVWSANGVIQTSDARLKTNIKELSYGLSELMQLKPVSYSWKDKPASFKIGLIAQEVHKVIPEVVSGDENTEALGMNYAELVPVLINSIKELKMEVDELKRKLEKLTKQAEKQQ